VRRFSGILLRARELQKGESIRRAFHAHHALTSRKPKAKFVVAFPDPHAYIRTMQTRQEATMLKVSLTNFGTRYSETFESFEAAVAFCKSKGFECTISDGKGNVAGSWSPLYGSRRF
jgi:hypothetical protein